jgi:hypothetical protein
VSGLSRDETASATITGTKPKANVCLALVSTPHSVEMPVNAIVVLPEFLSNSSKLVPTNMLEVFLLSTISPSPGCTARSQSSGLGAKFLGLGTSRATGGSKPLGYRVIFV